MKLRILFYTILVASVADLFSFNATPKSNAGFLALTDSAKGEYTALDLYLTSGGDINFQDEFGIGFLHVTVIRGDVKKTKELLAQGANPNIQTKTGVAPLHIACSVPYLTIVHFNAWMKSTPGMTNTLLAAQANPNIRTNLGLTPLHMSASMLSEDEDISQLGIKMPKVVGGKVTVVKVSTALSIAASVLYIGSLAAPAGSLSLAGISGAIAFVGSGIGLAPILAVGAAAAGITTAVVEVRIINQIRIKMKRLALLLEHGADVNATDNFGNTVLHYLAIGKLKDVGLKGRRGAALLAKRLKNAGANVSLKNDSGYTAYDIAKTNRRILLQQVLKPETKKFRPLKKLFKK